MFSFSFHRPNVTNCGVNILNARIQSINHEEQPENVKCKEKEFKKNETESEIKFTSIPAFFFIKI